MAGLLGMGGLGGAFGGPNTGKLSGPLAQLFNPTNMRNSQIKKGLLNAGIAMMSPDPYAPPAGIGGILGRAAAGGLQGADQAKQDYMQDGMFSMQLQEMQREQDERAQQQAAMEGLIPTLPPDVQSFARAYPKEFGEAWMRAKVGGAGGPEYGLNPIWAQDERGNWQLYQPNKQGGDPNPVNFPPGVRPQPQVNFLDTATGYQPRAVKGGTSVGEEIPKDLAGAEKQKVLGKGEGEAAIDYKSISSKMPGLEHVVRELNELAKTATYTSSGQLVDFVIRETGQEPRESAIARARYIAIVDNQILPMLRDTFGAQFTQKEGESLKVTLGDPNKSPAEKQAVLEAFIEQKRRNIEDMARMAGEQPGASAADPLELRR
jgi:hypothetical protein